MHSPGAKHSRRILNIIKHFVKQERLSLLLVIGCNTTDLSADHNN
jgi:predicted RNase H-related nuclease YkuK (DUF458 family)